MRAQKFGNQLDSAKVEQRSKRLILKLPIILLKSVQFQFIFIYRFGVTSPNEKIAQRSQRFGAGENGNSNGSDVGGGGANTEALKKRSERFGVSLNNSSGNGSTSPLDVEKANKRKERFGSGGGGGGEDDVSAQTLINHNSIDYI